MKFTRNNRPLGIVFNLGGQRMSDRLDTGQILLLIDPQNDFHGGGTLGILVETIYKLI